MTESSANYTAHRVALSPRRRPPASAVGLAFGRSPMAAIVPCHRVLACDGIGGFGLGLEAKRMLPGRDGMKA